MSVPLIRAPSVFERTTAGVGKMFQVLYQLFIGRHTEQYGTLNTWQVYSHGTKADLTVMFPSMQMSSLQPIDSKHPDLPSVMEEGKLPHIWLSGGTIAQQRMG